MIVGVCDVYDILRLIGSVRDVRYIGNADRAALRNVRYRRGNIVFTGVPHILNILNILNVANVGGCGLACLGFVC